MQKNSNIKLQDGIQQSYDDIFKVLDLFAQASGLKINFTKTKCVQTAAKYVQRMFLSLAMETQLFSVTLDEMEKLNYFPTFFEI